MSDFDLDYKPEIPDDGNGFEVMKGKGHVCKINYSRVEDYADKPDEHWGDPSWWNPDLIGHSFLNYELQVVQTSSSQVNQGLNYNGRKVWAYIDLNNPERKGRKGAEKTALERVADTFFACGLEFKNLDELKFANEKFAEMNLEVSFSSIPADRSASRKAVQLHTIKGQAKLEEERKVSVESEF